MAFLNPYFATRRWLNVGLVTAGAVAGATVGVVLTALGKVVAGAPPATASNYAWNAAVFGLLAGIVSPVVTWAALRRAPLWRTIAEPLALAVAGGAAGVLAGSGILFLALPPAGLVIGFVRLSRRYPQEPLMTAPQRAVAVSLGDEAR
jgi:hypothetical protein